MGGAAAIDAFNRSQPPIPAAAAKNSALADFIAPRESGALEQDVDLVLLLHRQDEGQVDLIVAKQRNSPIGVAKLLYVKQQMRFENLAVQTVRLG